MKALIAILIVMGVFFLLDSPIGDVIKSGIAWMFREIADIVDEQDDDEEEWDEWLDKMCDAKKQKEGMKNLIKETEDARMDNTTLHG